MQSKVSVMLTKVYFPYFKITIGRIEILLLQIEVNISTKLAYLNVWLLGFISIQYIQGR